MKKYNNKILTQLMRSLQLLAIVTGLFSYIPFYLLRDESFLVRGTPYFAGDVVIFTISLIIFPSCFFVWRAVYRQFKKDKTILGFEPDKRGVEVIVETIFMAIITALCFYFTDIYFR